MIKAVNLVQRFDKAPEAHGLSAGFSSCRMKEYLIENKIVEGDVDPDMFIR
jgi:hypothetical protein